MPDKNLNNLYRNILRAVQLGCTSKQNLAAFLGFSEQDNFVNNEIALLVKQGFLEDTHKNYSLTEMGEAYLENEFTIWVEDTIDYDFLLDTLTGNLQSLSIIKEIGKSHTGKSLGPDNEIFNHSKKYLKSEQIRDLFHNDYQGIALLIDFKNEQYSSKLVWRPLILAEYTSNNYEDPPYYVVRSANGVYQDFELTDEFNTRLMKHIPYLFA